MKGKVAKAVVLALLAHNASGTNVESDSTGISKVIEMLTDLAGKIEKDGKAEKASLAEYTTWCAKSQQEKGFEIKDATDEIDANGAKASKAAATSSSEASKIEELQSSVGKNQAELDDASKVRATERKAFEANEKELIDTAETIGKAVSALRQKSAALLQGPQDGKAATLLEAMKQVVDAAGLPTGDSQRLMALVQASNEAGDEMAAFGAQTPEAYTKKSGSILDMLQDLKDKAEVELADLRKAETQAKNNFELLTVSLKAEIKADSDDLADSKGLKSEADATKASASADLGHAQSNLKKAQSALQEITMNCKTVAADAEASAKSREEEMKAIEAAKAALSETSFLQQPSFIQIASHVKTPEDLHRLEVVSMLRQAARNDNAPALAQLADGVKNALTAGGPLDNVVKMITDMVAKMESRQAEDTKHQEYCKKEMTTSSDKQEKMEEKMEKLGAKKDKAEVESARLKKEVQDCQKDLTDLASSQAEADKIRQEEKKQFETAKTDLEEGLKGARTALQVLRDYYSKSGASFIQIARKVGQPAMPSFHSKSDTGAGGIVPMIEVVEEDLGKNLATKKMEERAAEESYNKLTQNNKESTISLNQDVQYKTKAAASLDKAALALGDDIESATTEKEAVDEYAKQIKESCVPKPGEAAAERAKQIEDLKQALEMLGSGGAFLQQKPISLHF
eukprot:TRINITY_DN94248_c0_g1_i1.p1 TRINITY_DN94248_c0_g1~~TRINITY_DN94248_c0_g1_i1.p1  ORF type:complete len:685 (-),score=248.44 TRINITY_DN94248_c0_g1_i1:130-2184(-)